MRHISDKRIFALVCLNVALYVFIVILDVMKAQGNVTQAQGYAGDAFKYSAIIACLLLCLFARGTGRREAARIQTIVFCFTLGADFFLLFTPYFAAGVAVFLGAHLCALIRYRPRWALPAGLCAAALFCAVLYFAPRLLRADAHLALLIALISTYALLIISVTISTFFAEQPRQNTHFSRLGMLLFLACDVNVFAFNALPAGGAVHTVSIVLMWLFYLPAQTLLALSTATLPLIQRDAQAEGKT